MKCVSHAIFWLPILKCHAARQLLDTLQLDTSSYYLHTSMFYTMNIVLTMVTVELHRDFNTLERDSIFNSIRLIGRQTGCILSQVKSFRNELRTLGRAPS